MWLTVHGFISQGREVDQVSHFIFGCEQGYFMALTGSVAPAFALHNLNLLFYGIQNYVGQYDLLRYGLPITIMVVWFGSMYLLVKLNGKKRQ